MGHEVPHSNLTLPFWFSFFCCFCCCFGVWGFVCCWASTTTPAKTNKGKDMKRDKTTKKNLFSRVWGHLGDRFARRTGKQEKKNKNPKGGEKRKKKKKKKKKQPCLLCSFICLVFLFPLAFFCSFTFSLSFLFFSFLPCVLFLFLWLRILPCFVLLL